MATGRVPNSDRLGLKYAGVEVHADGRVVVDSFQRTTTDGVWALGDVSTEHQLKHVANHEARVVAHNLAHPGELTFMCTSPSRMPTQYMVVRWPTG